MSSSVPLAASKASSQSTLTPTRAASDGTVIRAWILRPRMYSLVDGGVSSIGSGLAVTASE